MQELLIAGIECYAYHGCLAEEEIIGCKYVVDVLFSANLMEAVSSDNIDYTIDYTLVHELVKREMAIPSRLIEHVAGRIHRSLLQQFTHCPSIRVSVTKLRPPVHGYMDKAVFSIS